MFVLVLVVQGKHFAINNGTRLKDSCCKSEMYIIRIIDFFLSSAIVFLCIDRCIKQRKFCYGQRRFITVCASR